ncbi:MAG: 3-oxoacyl-[acyl-carrier-protein] reductase [Bacteroidia bacterium]|nr:3-oxoacyl-[acyl-carrier-protein] reductase [Bacteroidia bacterium]
MQLLEGKVAVITGASRGIGRAIAKKFAEHGAVIAFSDLIDDDNMQSLVQELTSKVTMAGSVGTNGRSSLQTVKGYASNAASLSAAEKLVNDVLNEFNNIDILVNNAGITRDNLLLRMTEEQWDTVINVNLKSVFNLTKAVQRPMLRQRSGSIINISSIVGIGGNAGQANYAASKAGIIGFTKSVAKELGTRNIRCNAIAPGFIITEMTQHLSEEMKNLWTERIPLKRGGLPEEVANVALFLASDMASYVSGQVINVCGGLQT